MHLIIAEKKIAAQRIAGILSGKEKLISETIGGVPTFRFGDTVFMGLRGHVVEIDFEPGYTNWRSETHTPRTLIDAGTVKKPTERKIVALIRKLSKGAESVTIATDFDREGELIGKEAYEIVRGANKSVTVRRARFSAITPSEITEAFAAPAEIDFNLASAGEARQLVDLVWGASLTRFISIAAKRGGKSILSVGRVQSPTLAMIVDREKAIEAFVPEPYWMLSVASEKMGEAIEARHTHGRYDSRKEAEGARDRTSGPLAVISVKKGEKNDRAPAPLDTTSFIVAAARLRFSASAAMRIAEELYMNGHISYPRTDNTVYPASLDLGEILTELTRSPFKKEAEWVAANRRKEPTRGKKSSTDHPPIHPAGAAKREDLNDQQWAIYELIVRRFLATLSPDARWETMKYVFDAGGEEYTATGSHLAEKGYRRVYPYSEAKEIILPLLKEGEKLPVNEVILEEKETNPPARYSQSKLIQRMEELGLGTKSTRHEVIGKLYSRRYVEGTPMRPTLVGLGVTEALENHASLITKPDMTKTLEDHMEEIKKAMRSQEDVVSESKGMLHNLFDELELHEMEIGQEIMERTDEERIIGPCPVCGHDLMIRRVRGMSQFIGCTGYPDCRFNISLPSAQWGSAIRQSQVCEIHGLNHIFLVRKGARPWEIGCPLCSHINGNRKALEQIPDITEEIILALQARHIYSVYDVAKLPLPALADAAGISRNDAEKLIMGAEEVLESLRRIAELKRFVRKTIPPRRGRSHSKVMEGLKNGGITSLDDLASATPALLTSLKLGDNEALALIVGAKEITCTRILREMGVPAASLKKYIAAGFMDPENFCTIPPAYLSLLTGISVETVWRHAEKVCESLGEQPPVKVSKKAFLAGKEEILAIQGVGEATLEKLFFGGIINAADLAGADPGALAAASGISREDIIAYQKKIK